MPVTIVRDATIPAELPQVRTLFDEYAAGVGIDLSFQGFDEERVSLPGRYAAPDGGLWLAFADDRVVGCIALRPLTGSICEIKRLYVRPDGRGSGTGRMLAEAALARAAVAGFDAVRLDTLPTMHGAIALYRSLGFTAVEPYYANPVPGALFFERRPA